MPPRLNAPTLCAGKRLSHAIRVSFNNVTARLSVRQCGETMHWQGTQQHQNKRATNANFSEFSRFDTPLVAAALPPFRYPLF